jgi:hypothetical protein
MVVIPVAIFVTYVYTYQYSFEEVCMLGVMVVFGPLFRKGEIDPPAGMRSALQRHYEPSDKIALLSLTFHD